MLTLFVNKRKACNERALDILPGSSRFYPKAMDWSRADLPHIKLLLGLSPEIFLNWQNNELSRGVRGMAIVLGYTCFSHDNSSGEALARKLISRWRNEGDKFVRHLEGSFSLFLYDADRAMCLIATDPMGTRPLWHAQDEFGNFIFSSNVCEIALRLSSLPEMDKAYAWSFLHRRATVANRSFFKGIEAVAPGYITVFEKGVISNGFHYAEPVVQPDHKRSTRDTAGLLLDALKQTAAEAVADSRSPVLLLSGGLDSRLVAGISGPEVTAVTLCDRYNNEVRISERIARQSGLAYRYITRSPEWYPEAMERACWNDAGLYCWNESHFLPLDKEKNLFPYDVAMLGFASDTLFKGVYLDWPALWEGWQIRSGPELSETEFVELVLRSPGNFNPWLRPVLKDAFIKESEEAFRSAVAEKYRQICNWASFAPDLWSLYSFDSMHRNNSFSNLTSLRFTTSERNLFSSPRIWRLFLTIPCYQIVQRPKAIVTEMLKRVGKQLVWIPDANSWLPVHFPEWAQKTTLSMRARIARVRNVILNSTGNTSISGSSGWTRFDRLLIISKTLRDNMNSLLTDDCAFPGTMFDHDALDRLWKDHLNGKSDNANQLYQLASFANFRRQLYSS